MAARSMSRTEPPPISPVAPSTATRPAAPAGGLVADHLDHLTVTDCTFGENDGGEGCAARIYGCLDVTFERNSFVGNTSGGGAPLMIDDTPMVVADCLFANNVTDWANGIEVWDSDPTTITGCTFVANTMTQSGYGGCALSIYGIDEGPAVTLENCIIAENGVGEPVYASDGTATLHCSLVWGNTDGDWLGAIAGQDTLNGNLAVEPLLCDPEAGDYQLCADSPCLPANNPECTEPIGVYEQGCPPCGSPVETTSWGAIKALYK